ncbi:MAG: ATP-binding protein [Candidatus Saccharibacteria bacterium]
MNDYLVYGRDLVIGVSLLLLGSASLLKKGYKKPVNQYFFLFSLVSAIWLVAYDFSDRVELPIDLLQFINAVSTAAALACFVILLLFVGKLADFPVFNKYIKWSLWPLWIICALSATPLINSTVTASINNYGGYSVTYGPLVWLYLLAMVYVLIFIGIEIIYGLNHAKGIKNQQLNIVGIGITLAMPATVTLALIMPLLTGSDSWTYYSTVPLLLLSGYMYYGAFRYKLLDIRSAIVHTLTYLLSMSTLIVIYYVAVATISAFFLDHDSVINQSPISTVLFLALLFIFQPINSFFEKLTSRVFFRGHYTSDELFARLNHIYSENTADLKRLLDCSANEVSETIKSEQALICVKYSNKYINAGTKDHCRMPYEIFLQLQSYFAKNNQTIVASALEEDDPIRNLISQCKIEIIVPLTQAKNIGFLCLGEHLSSRYTARDIKVLDTTAGGLVIAIKNALSIQEIKDVNAASMQQKIDSATKELAANNAMLIKIDEEKDDFVSVTSHELRTPMTIINGYANLLQGQQLGSLNEKQLDIINKIGTNAKALIGITNDMLDLSKMEANKAIVHITNASLAVLINEAINTNKILYDDKSISLTYEGSDVQIKTDASSFEHIMTNLLANANKFTDSGGSVKITSCVDNTTHLATICVTDTGIGISPESIGNLFKKFSQVDNYLKRQYGGTGLGLAICKQMVERLGGTIWVTSTPGVGSKFCFTMPIVENNTNNTIS